MDDFKFYYLCEDIWSPQCRQNLTHRLTYTNMTIALLLLLDCSFKCASSTNLFRSLSLLSFVPFFFSCFKSNDLTRVVIAKLICGLSLCRMRALLSFHPCQDNSSCQALIRFVSTAPAQQLLTFEIHSIIKATRESE